ncbi:hypothetical protein OKJ48_33980 [Streptomyces kunmingensis]|uniref:DUF4132 domain-containing protein n=1 Tax=Streptomyces kunmingensis TaxID=68225 RepID=A0ABU6CKG5_9ACTN|nr:hypothetical protein [Streptomyces kunmingensis]MEB3965198.1 hypothetical protein [Streptomyces kunmingensis]
MTEQQHTTAGTDLLGDPAIAALIRAIQQRLGASPQLNTPEAARDMLWRVKSSHRDIRHGIDASASYRTQVQQLLELCAREVSWAEALAGAIEQVTQDPVAAAPLRTLADWRAAQKWVTVTELTHLQPLVQDIPEADALSAARACLPPLSADLPPHCTQAWPTVLHLLRRNILPSGLPPFLAFLEYLAASAPDQRGRLQRWTTGKAESWGLGNQLLQCRSAAADFVLPEPGHARVMFVLLPDGLNDDQYTLRMWHRDGIGSTSPALRDEDSRAVRGDELRAAVIQRLSQWVSQTTHTAQRPLIEFWLPLALVNQPVWEWCTDSRLPDPNAPVVVRSLDRLELPTIEEAWRARWESQINQQSDEPEPLTRVTAPQPAPSVPVTAEPAAPSEPVILQNPPSKRQGRAEFMEALRTGAPAILWHRYNCSPAFHTLAQRLIDDGPLDELPLRVNALRAGTLYGRPPSDTARDITFIWDDPENTLPAVHDLVAPAEAGLS